MEDDALAADAVEQPTLVTSGNVVEHALLLEQDGGVRVVGNLSKICFHVASPLFYINGLISLC